MFSGVWEGEKRAPSAGAVLPPALVSGASCKLKHRDRNSAEHHQERSLGRRKTRAHQCRNQVTSGWHSGAVGHIAELGHAGRCTTRQRVFLCSILSWFRCIPSGGHRPHKHAFSPSLPIRLAFPRCAGRRRRRRQVGKRGAARRRRGVGAARPWAAPPPPLPDHHPASN